MTVFPVVGSTRFPVRLEVCEVSRTLRPTIVVALTLTLIGASLVYLAPRGLAAPQGRLVDDVPVARTPDVLGKAFKQRVNAVAKIGDTVFLGGTFDHVKAGGRTYARDNIVAFSASTGEVVDAFDPDVGASVDTILPAPGGDAVFIGGGFDVINGKSVHKFAKINLRGELVSGFDLPAINGRVRDLALSGGRLFVAGDFSHVAGKPHRRMVTLDPQSGEVDPFLDLHFTGTHNGGFPSVREFDISAGGERLVAVGNFRRVGGAHREQLAMIDLGGSSAALADWRTSRYEGQCGRNFNTYMRDVAFSPGGSYFAVVTTGGAARSEGALCDTATRWETDAAATDVQPTWVNYTGNDTLTAVAVAGGVVYVGGHQRWLNNPYGAGEPGPGAVPRPGLAALDPGNGLPLAWNPGRIPRGYGVTDMFVTDRGLWVGSDTEWIGQYRYRRERIAFFPFASGKVVPQAKTARLPGDVYLLGEGSVLGGGGRVTYRSYDGQSVGGSGTKDAGGLDERTVRGAFLIGDTLWYGSENGKLYRRGFDGETFGKAAAPNPYDWPFRQGEGAKKFPGRPSEFYDRLPAVTGMFYTDGRLYYTLAGEPRLYYRDFAPSSAIIGAERQAVDTAPKWASARGMFLSGGDLYYASANGNLHRMGFENGRPVGGSHEVVEESTDWAARGLFLQKGGGAPAPEGEGQSEPPPDGGSAPPAGGDEPPADGGGIIPEVPGGDGAVIPELPAVGGDGPADRRPRGDGPADRRPGGDLLRLPGPL